MNNGMHQMILLGTTIVSYRSLFHPLLDLFMIVIFVRILFRSLVQCTYMHFVCMHCVNIKVCFAVNLFIICWDLQCAVWLSSIDGNIRIIDVWVRESQTQSCELNWNWTHMWHFDIDQTLWLTRIWNCNF